MGWPRSLQSSQYQSSEGKTAFPQRKEELEPGCLLQQLLGEQEGRATITTVPSRWPRCQHLLLYWPPLPAWAPSAWSGHSATWPSAAMHSCWLCQRLRAGKIPQYMEKPGSPRIWTEKWAVAVCWDQIAQPCLALSIFSTFFFPQLVQCVSFDFVKSDSRS